MTNSFLKWNSDINAIAKNVFALAKEKGWHRLSETENEFIERTCNNLHDEVSELHEAWRNNRLHEPCDKEGSGLTCLEEELADIIIRALDSATTLGITDISEIVRKKHLYNANRSFMHGGKKS